MRDSLEHAKLPMRICWIDGTLHCAPIVALLTTHSADVRNKGVGVNLTRDHLPRAAQVNVPLWRVHAMLVRQPIHG